jgi:hypothetical protein
VRNKAERGELRLALPVGLDRDEDAASCSAGTSRSATRSSASSVAEAVRDFLTNPAYALFAAELDPVAGGARHAEEIRRASPRSSRIPVSTSARLY